MKASKKAENLISDFVQMMPGGIDKVGYKFNTQYEVAKIQAKYCAHVAKWSHRRGSKKFNYWLNVQNEIEKL